MALIDKLTAIGDAIRGKTGKEDTLTLEEMVTEIGAIDTQAQTYILVDEDGNEIPAVLVDEPVNITATANDIRLGTTAVTNDGVTTGTKEIPSYHTTEGQKIIKAGRTLEIPMYSDKCQYSKLQVIVCVYDTSLSNSVSAEMVVINDKLYKVGSSTVLSNVIVDIINQTINLGLTNDNDHSLLLRYMTIKEEQ